MFNLLEIVKNDWATYYNFGSEKKTPPIKRLVLIIVLSGVLASLKHSGKDNFLIAVVSVEAILVGFSFSVMFFLLAEDRPRSSQNVSIEVSARWKKLDTLSKEIFYNVSYFNLVSIFCVFTALILSLPSYGLAPQKLASDIVSWMAIPPKYLATFQNASSLLVPLAFRILWTLLYFFLAQSLCTLIRTIGRVHFYFSEKILLNSAEKTGG